MAMPFFMACSSMYRCHLRWPDGSVVKGAFLPPFFLSLSWPPERERDDVVVLADALFFLERLFRWLLLRLCMSATAAIMPTASATQSATCHGFHACCVLLRVPLANCLCVASSFLAFLQ